MVILTALAVLTITRFSLAVPLDLNATSTNALPQTDTNVQPSQIPEAPFLIGPPGRGAMGLSSSPVVTANQPFYLPYYPTTTSAITTRIGEGAATETLAVFVPPVTVTIANPPSTTTEYITIPPSTVTEVIVLPETSILLSPSPSEPSSSAPTSIQPQVTPSTKSTWSTPPQMTDLSSFNILSFAGGQHNLKIVSGLPPSAQPYSSPLSSALKSASTSAVIQLEYPAHSINPSRFPLGGAQFYASPISLATAHNVSFQYSVFFPQTFDWVLGGKLPGLYGGHKGCSGGSDARDCFSTRLMWREGGAGELYLYAPKTRQSPALCASSGSICNIDYGFSIGRGSFRWQQGAWTKAIQTVVLNTPGRADGWFMLDVDGRRVIERKDVFYRDEVVPRSGVSHPPRPTRTQTQVEPTKTSGDGLLGGILDPLLGGGKKLSPVESVKGEQASGGVGIGAFQQQGMFSVNTLDHGVDPTPRTEELLGIKLNLPLLPDGGGDENDGLLSIDVGLDKPDYERLKAHQPVGFTGIFFSTFFGGHDKRYETPKHQQVWFKEFGLIINA